MRLPARPGVPDGTRRGPVLRASGAPGPVVAGPVVAGPVVAVQVGTSATRLAARGPDGRPELVATLPAGTTAGSALAALHGDAPPAVLLVHPAGWGPDEVATAAAALRCAAEAVRTVASPIAVLAGVRRADAGPDDPAGAGTAAADVAGDRPGGGAPWAADDPVPRLVVESGASGTDLTVVVGGRVMPAHRVDVGGNRLDAALGAGTGLSPARARAVREALSLRQQVTPPGERTCDAARCRELIRPALAELADAVREAAGRSRAGEVVLAGGLARTPLLAELLDDVVACPVRVLEAPESAAVRGGAVQDAEDGQPLPDAVGSPPAAISGPPAPASGPVADSGVGRRARERRWSRRIRGAPVVAALGIALVAVGTVAGRAPTTPDPPRGPALVQYGYATALPAGWEHTGGMPERRRSILTRPGSPDGGELIAVERSPLGYDSDLEPERARAELAAEFRRRAVQQDLRDYRADTVAGRAVLRYRQAGPGPAVDWFVLFAGTDELVVGCRYPDAPSVGPACAAVVASVRPAVG